MQVELTQEQVNETRGMVQNMAYRAWENASRKGTIVAATGFGKSKLAVRRIQEVCNESFPLSNYCKPGSQDYRIILLVTPTEKLRDENWPAEFEKWGIAEKDMNNLVKRICFASLKNEKGSHYKLVILDEIHRLTELNAQGFLQDGTLTQFFADNMADEVMGLTATEPDPDRDKTKADIIRQVAPVCFRYSLDDAVRDGLAPSYEIRVIMVPLDKVTKNIPAGTKATPFLTTEFASYEFLEKKVKKAFATKKQGFIQKMVGARMRFIIDLPSKTRVAQKVLAKVLPGKRTLVFCGSIEQSRKLCGENVYNSSAEDKKRDMLSDFKDQKIDYLGVVNAVNEGHNIPMMDQGVIVQMNSNERDFIQRIGRMLRYRPGYTTTIYVIIAQGTKDHDWFNKATEGIDRKKITYDSYLNYL